MDYGEDVLAERSLRMAEEERVKIDKISAWYELPDYPLPMTGSVLLTITLSLSRRSRSSRAQFGLLHARAADLRRTVQQRSTNELTSAIDPDVAIRRDPSCH